MNPGPWNDTIYDALLKMLNGEPDKIPYDDFCNVATTAADLKFKTNGGNRIQCNRVYLQPYGNDGGNLRRVTRGANMNLSEPPVVVSKIEPHKSAEAEGYANNEIASRTAKAVWDGKRISDLYIPDLD